jgi:hypothetical protein
LSWQSTALRSLTTQSASCWTKFSNLFAASLSERLRTAEVDGVGLYQFGVELVLADELAEMVADLRATAVPVAIRVRWGKLLNRTRAFPGLPQDAERQGVQSTERS